MNKVEKLEFELDEADRLIAAYGQKPDPEERQSLEDYLRGQKARFDEIERDCAQSRNGPDRGH